MPTEIRMPMWGMGMLEGTIVEWYKHEGDAVDVGERLVEIEAAKTTEDLLSPAAGILQRIVVAQDETVPVQALLAVLVTEGEEAELPVSAGADAPDPATAQPPHNSHTAHASVRNVVPRARQRAKQLGIELSTLEGTGPGGRITVDDVEGATKSDTAAEDDSAVPLSGMRGTIARRMVESLQSMAQLTLFTTADVTELVEHRSASMSEPRATYTDYMVRAAALSLRDHKRLNATIDGERIKLLDRIHIGIATALPEGLVVPVIRDADTIALDTVARTSARLIDRVRNSDYGLEDVSGATFTITSLGGQGIDSFTPIINPPEVAILGIGRIIDHPIRYGDGVRWRNVMSLSLTIDHRVVDGVPGAAFLATLSELLATPETLAG